MSGTRPRFFRCSTLGGSGAESVVLSSKYMFLSEGYFGDLSEFAVEVFYSCQDRFSRDSRALLRVQEQKVLHCPKGKHSFGEGSPKTSLELAW